MYKQHMTNGTSRQNTSHRSPQQIVKLFSSLLRLYLSYTIPLNILAAKVFGQIVVVRVQMRLVVEGGDRLPIHVATAPLVRGQGVGEDDVQL